MAITVFMAKPEGIPGTKSFICDATISIAPTFENVITQHPVEKSGTISDHAYNQNPTIKIEGVVSNSYAQGQFIEYVDNEVNYNSNRVKTAYDLLKALWAEKGVFTIHAEYDSYGPCILKQFSTDFTKETSEALIFTLVAQQIRTAEAQEVDITLLTETLQDDAAKNVAGNDVKEEATSDDLADQSWLIFNTGGAILDEGSDILGGS